MTWVFWISAAVILYTYVGYACFLWLLAKISPKPITKAEIEPSVSIVMAVHNEVSLLPAKLHNLAALDYPKDQLQVVIASDGSTDGTNEFLRHSPGVLPVFCPENRGKATALNNAMDQATGDVIVFTDVRQELEPNAIRELVKNFSDPSVGCVSGELMFLAKGGQPSGVSLYWRLEKFVRKLESASGSVVGATGAIYAVRRSLVPTVPEGTLLDDVYIPVHVATSGYRVIFEPAARAWDEEPEAGSREFQRKVRTLAGNYQLIGLRPTLMSLTDTFAFRFVSHKFLRLVVPFALLLNFFCAWALSGELPYLAAAIAQSLFYILATISLFAPVSRLSRVTSAPAAFCVLNAAAIIALYKFVRYRTTPTRIWKKDIQKEETLSVENIATPHPGRNS